MDDRDKKKVVLIKGDNTKCYEQAIFILKPDIPQNKIPINFVAEAEKIINNCFHKTLFKQNTNTALSTSKSHNIQPSRPYKRNKTKTKKNNALNTILIISIVLLVILFSIIFYSIFNETLI